MRGLSARPVGPESRHGLSPLPGPVAVREPRNSIPVSRGRVPHKDAPMPELPAGAVILA